MSAKQARDPTVGEAHTLLVVIYLATSLNINLWACTAEQWLHIVVVAN